MATRIRRTALDTPVEEAPEVRTCREVGCTTVLSQYNSTAWCGVHSRRDWRANREPRRRSVATTLPDDADQDW